MPIVVRVGKTRARMWKWAGFCMAAAGAVLCWQGLAATSGWSQLPLGSFAVPTLNHMHAVSLGWGTGLLFFGAVLSWANRSGLRKKYESPVDAKPVAEWVRAFEKHQAEMIFERGRSYRRVRRAAAAQALRRAS